MFLKSLENPQSLSNPSPVKQQTSYVFPMNYNTEEARSLWEGRTGHTNEQSALAF